MAPDTVVFVLALGICCAIAGPYMLTTFTPSKIEFIDNYNNCKESQVKQIQQNELIVTKCQAIAGLNMEICDELYNLTIANRTNIKKNCDHVCKNIISPIKYERCDDECNELFETYKLVYCMSENNYQQCITNYDYCRFQMLVERIMRFIAIVVGITALIYLLSHY